MHSTYFTKTILGSFLFSLLLSGTSVLAMNDPTEDGEKKSTTKTKNKKKKNKKKKNASQIQQINKDSNSDKETQAFYGGSQAHEIFQRGVKNAVPQLSEMMRAYRENPAGGVQKIIQAAVKTRYDIAQKAGTEDAHDFGVFRKDLDAEYAITGTHEPRYRTLRGHLQARIRELIKTKGHEIKGKSTSIKLQQIPYAQWKNCYELNVKGYAAQRNITPGVSSEEEMINVCKTLEYVREFSTMCIEVVPGDGIIFKDYIAALKTLSTGKFGKPSKTQEVVQSPEMEPVTQIIPSCFSTHPKFYQVDITNGTYIGNARGYGFLAMIPSGAEEKGDFPIMIYHTENRYLPHQEDLYLRALTSAITADSADSEKLIEKVARFCSRWARSMPLVRGSASVMQDLLMPAVFNSHGYVAERVDAQGPTVDQMGYMHWTEEEFVEAYKKAIVLKRLDAEN